LHILNSAIENKYQLHSEQNDGFNLEIRKVQEQIFGSWGQLESGGVILLASDFKIENGLRIG
jgi:hypothetical protein